MSKKAKKDMDKDNFVGKSKGANLATKTSITGNRMLRKMRR